MEQPTRDNGSTDKGTDTVLNCGRTALDTKECGDMTKQTDRENLSMLMAISTKGNGLMTKLRDRELTLTRTEPITRDNG